MQAVQPDRLIDIKEARPILGVSKTKFYAMVSDGELPPPKKFGRSSRWRLSDIRKAAGLGQGSDPAIEELL